MLNAVILLRPFLKLGDKLLETIFRRLTSCLKVKKRIIFVELFLFFGLVFLCDGFVSTSRFFFIDLPQSFILVTQILELLHQIAQVFLSHFFLHSVKFVIKFSISGSLEVNFGHHLVVAFLIGQVLCVVS